MNKHIKNIIPYGARKYPKLELIKCLLMIYAGRSSLAFYSLSERLLSAISCHFLHFAGEAL